MSPLRNERAIPRSFADAAQLHFIIKLYTMMSSVELCTLVMIYDVIHCTPCQSPCQILHGLKLCHALHVLALMLGTNRKEIPDVVPRLECDHSIQGLFFFLFCLKLKAL